MPNRVKNIPKWLIGSGLLLVAFYSEAQSNIPSTQIQPPPPTTAVSATPNGYSAGIPLNYVRSWNALGPWTDAATFSTQANTEVTQTTAYVDGLGRPLQTVIRQASPSGKDVVSPVLYDELGREVYKYLPYTSTTSDGNFKTDPFTEQHNFFQAQYPGEQVFYTKTEYESSPLNRVIKTMAQGNSWAGSNRGTVTKYLVNTAADEVKIWHVNNAIAPESSSTDIYPEGELYKNVVIDEAGHTVVEFKDKEGQIILKKVQVKENIPSDFSGTDDKWLLTYYVYDGHNQLRFVLPPKAVAQLRDHYNWQLATGTIPNVVLTELCFQYTYDSRNRMISKKIPGADWVNLIYDLRNRVVFTQDGNMRQQHHWLTSLYDDLNRPVLTGMITYVGTAAALQAQVNANSTGNSSLPISGEEPNSLSADITINTLQSGILLQQASNSITWDEGFITDATTDLTAEIINNGTGGNIFTNNIAIYNNPIPTGAGFIPLTITYYDNYTAGNKTYTTNYNSELSAGGNLHVEANPTAAEQSSVGTKGLVTITRVRTLPDVTNLDAGSWLTNTGFYDKKGRVIQTHYDNYKGGTDVTTNLYDFGGKILCSVIKHSNPQNIESDLSNITVRTRMEYDVAGRLLTIKKSINQDYTHEKLITENVYDESGQLITKTLGVPGSGLGTLDYNYNVRGWLQGINKVYANNSGGGTRAFGMELNYDWGFGTSQYNGNIAGTKWRSMGDAKERSYGFGYDAVNRLLFADFKQQNGASWDNSDGIDFTSYMGDGISATAAYDENGNILKMKQWGLKVNTSSPIDDLIYTYVAGGVSNKLQNVIDGVNNTDTRLGDFKTSVQSINLAVKNSGDPNTIIDYTYDVNGNLTTDLNKDIHNDAGGAGIKYNYLNLPASIVITTGTETKGTIHYIYDAAGNKLEKITDEWPGFRTGNIEKITSTVYIGGFTYENNKLQFLGQEEGRIRPKHDQANTLSFVYDFFVKDHLGSVRSVLTDEEREDKYPAATLETATLSSEKEMYVIPDDAAVRVNKNTVSGYPADNTTSPNDFIQKLIGNGTKIGSSITLKVMAGDKVNIKVSSWYKTYGNNPATPASPVTELLNTLINSVSASSASGTHGVTSNELQTSNALSQGLTDFLGSQPDNGGKPKAYLNWILFDEQFKFVSSSSNVDPVGDNEEFKQHVKSNLPIDKNGYFYVYVSNETPNIPVFFDNLQVTHIRGCLMEETHYYPFGLTMAGISSKAASVIENKIKYNGKEEQRKEFSDGSGLEWMDYGARMYDGQIGRWFSVDPMAEKTYSQTPYNYGLNSPVNYVDVGGYFSILHHHDFTYNALKKFGYNSNTRDLVSHYASTYADNPTGFKGALIRFWENSPRWSGVDYSATKNSQNTASIENSTWHSMRADGENISEADAMARGQEFGWNKIFEAGSEIKKVGGMGNLKKNSKGVQALGQGIHALQDAVAHRGTDMDHHDTWQDMQPGQKLYDQASNVTEGALLVTEIMSGNGQHLTDGMSININGMTTSQLQKLTTTLSELMKNNDGVNKINLVNTK